MSNYNKRGNNVILLIGISFILFSLFLIFFVFGATFGTLFLGLVGFISIYIYLLNRLYYIDKYKSKIKLLRKISVLMFIIFLISFFIVEALIFYTARTTEQVETEYLIILGAGLRGTEPSLTLKNRLETGLEYLNQYPNAQVIVSGGQGKGEDITEAEAMKRYLVNNGIDENRIIKEEQSTSTKENIQFTEELLVERGDYQKEITIVTSEFHMFRAKYFAEKYGFEPYGVTAETPYYILLNYSLREYFAVLKAFVVNN